MFTLSQLLACMPEKPLLDLLYDGGCSVNNGIYLLEPTTVLEPGSIYVGEPSVILPFLSRNYPFTVTFVSAGTCPEYRGSLYENINLCITEIDLTSLYNYMNRTLMRFLSLHSEFSDLSHRRGSPESVVRIVSDYLPGAGVYLLDSGLKLIARKSAISEKEGAYSAFARKLDRILTTAGYLEVTEARELEAESTRRGNHSLFFKNLSGARFTSHYLLLLFPEAHEAKPMTVQLIRQIYTELIDYFTENAPPLLISPEIDAFVQALMDRRIKTRNEARSRLLALGAPVFKYVNCLIVEFDDRHTHTPAQADYLAGKLRELFPQAAFASYQGDLLLLTSASRSGEFPQFERETMNALLESCGACLGISFPIRSLISLPTMYWDVKNAISCGRQYDKTGAVRIFYVKDFVFDKILDLCACPGNNAKTNGNLGYLCSPIIITLLRYDHRHGTDYTRVLEEYVNSGESIAACARRMYIHRNTLVNKLAKIEEITGCDLHDTYFMHTIFFGFQTYRYITDIQGKNLITELDK